MQAQQGQTQQHRSSITHSRRQTSSSSIGAPDSSQTFDSQQQQHHPQNEAQESMQRRPSQTAASQLSKLDGVIYHFYTTTANLIIQSRLAHLRPLLLATPPFDATMPEQRSVSAAMTSSQTKLSRWFGLHIPDSDLFKEELRFWRSLTSLMGVDNLDHVPLPATSSVPDLVIDVLLDLSRVSERHEILIVTNPSSSGSIRLSQSHASSSRVCVDGRKPGDAAPSDPSSRPRRIVLERWRLRFEPVQPSDPPDLSTFYKRSVLHFRTLFTLLCSLPANRFAAKIDALKAGAQDRGNVSHPSHPSLAAREDMGSYDAEMTIGCRLDMASSGSEQAAPTLSEEVNVTEALPAERTLSLSENTEAELAAQDRITSHGHYATRTLPPIATPVGHLELSVTYRKLAGFSIEDAESLRNANDIQVDLDEDYFRIAQRAEPTPLPTSNPPSAPTTSPPQIFSQSGSSQQGGAPVPAPAQQRIGGISAARPATLAAQRYSPDATPAGTDALLSHSPANTSVFSTSASGRHSAGLSSLRRTSSNKSSFPLMVPANASPAPSSPALAAALSAEPAFAVPSSVRRPSTSERRLRTLSGLSSGQPSPPVSPAAATFELPEAGTSVPRSTSAAFSTSVTGRSISTRTTSGFSTGTAGNMGPPSSQPKPSVSFSPSSPSPLSQQMSMQGSRVGGGGQGLVPSASQSVSSFRSVSGSGMRSSMAGTGVLTTPSLRSVFQNYVPRSQGVSTASIARTPPTSTSVYAHGSYSPSNLGTGLRSSTSIRRNSSTSEAGSGSAFGTSVTSSSAAAAAAAKPQMIKRYSTNFSYRQNRERSGIYGSSLGSEGSGSVGAGAEPSSYPRFGGGGSLSSAYGRSWVSRMEQRQGLGTGGAFARTSSLDDATAAATASSALRYRHISGTSAAQMGGLTPSPRSHEEDIDDLVRLLETRPAFGTSSMGKLTSLRNERRNAPGLSSTPEEGGGGGRAGPASDALTDSVQSNLGQDRPSSLSGSGLRSGAALRTANPMSRSQLDELLSRMAESVGIIGSKEPGSSASGETSSDVAASDDNRHQAIPAVAAAAAQAAPARSSANQHAPSSQPLTAAQVAATLGKGRGSQRIETESAADTPTGRVSSPGTFGRAVSGDAGLRSRSAVGQQVRAYGTSAVRATSGSGLITDQQSRFPRESAAITSTPPAPASNVNSDQMPEYEAEGDLIFKVDGQPEYDPEDELPGEMEMVAEGDEGGTGTAVRSSADAVTLTYGGGGGGVEGGIGATLPVGAHREGRTHDWHAADRWERERALEAERRRADAEMSRNFGQEVGASTRGRGSHSPWRATTHSPALQQQAATAVPMSLQSQSTAGAVGFRSSSTRPLTGTTNRLVGVGAGGGAGFGDGRGGKRGYGVSAPSTQFHYPTGQGVRPTANSYPVSRDEMFDDEEEEVAEE